MSKPLLIDFHIVGAGIDDANGRYFISTWGANVRPEYLNYSNKSFKIKWSQIDCVWTLQHISSGCTLYMIVNRSDLEFPYDAQWICYSRMNGAHVPVSTKV